MKVAAALIVVLCVAVASSDAQIKGVALLFRHGQRTPNYVFPTYGMTTQTQELGTGQLTVVRKLIFNNFSQQTPQTKSFSSLP